MNLGLGSIFRGGVVLPQGGVGAWDELSTYGPGPVVKVADGSYYGLFEGVANDGLTDHLTQTGLMTSVDGLGWPKYVSNPVLVPSAVTWENNEASVCGLVYNPSGSPATWELWYHGGNNTGGSGGGRAIGYATSADLITITKYGSNPVLQKGASGAWDGKWVADAHVIKVAANDYRMWYGGTRVSDGKRQIGYATCTDGISWAKYGGNPILTWGSSGAFDETDIQAFCPFMVSATEWIAFYIGLDVGGNGAIGAATSTDGIALTKSPLNPLLSTVTGDAPTGSIHVYQDGGLLRLMRGSFDAGVTPTLRAKRQDTVVIKAATAPRADAVDHFNRANEATLSGGGKWTTGITGGTGLKLASNTVIRQGASGVFGRDGSLRNDITFPAGISCEVGCTVTATGSDGELDLFLWNAGAAQGYALNIAVGSFGSEFDLLRYDSTSTSVVLATSATAVAAGDIVALQVDGDEIVGWLFRSGAWSELMRAYDGTYRPSLQGGMEIAGFNDVTSLTVDDFWARSLATSTAPAGASIPAILSRHPRSTRQPFRGFQPTEPPVGAATTPVSATASDPFEELQKLAILAVDPFEALKALVAAGATDPIESLQKVSKVGSNDPLESNQIIKANSAFPYEALQKLASTLAYPFSALKSLTIAGSTDPYEALQKVNAPGSVDPVDAGQGVAATKSVPYEALKALALAGSSDPIEALKALVIAGSSDPVEALKALTAVGSSDPVEALKKLAAVGSSDPFEANRGIAATLAAAYEALQKIAAVGPSDPAESTQGIASSKSIPFEVLQKLATTLAYPLEALKTLLAAGSADPIEALQIVKTVGSGDVVEVLQGIAARASDPLEALAALQKSLADPLESLAVLRVAGSSEPLEALQAVQGAGVLILDALQGIARVLAGPYEALQKIQQTGSDPYETSAAMVIQTASIPYEALQNVTAIRSDGIEALKGLANTAADALEALQGVAASRQEPLEASQRLAATVQGSIESLQKIVNQLADPLEALKGVKASGSDPAEALQGIKATSSDPFESTGVVLTGVTQTAVLIIEALQGLTVSKSEPVESLSLLAIARSTAVESLVPITAAYQAVVEALAGIKATVTTIIDSIFSGFNKGTVVLTQTEPGEATVSASEISESATMLAENAGLATTDDEGSEADVDATERASWTGEPD